MTYFAVIGDLNDSRELENRAEVQHQMQAVIAQLNEQTAGRHTAPLKLTAGDEVQGISEDPCYALEVVLALSDAVAPAQFSWGVGFGELSTDITDDVALLDGPCFHEARKALEKSRRKGCWFEAEGIDSYSSTVLNAMMNLMGAIREDWTAKQAAYVRQARDHSQIDVARSTGKAPSTISRALRATKFDRVVEGEHAARLVLEQLSDA